MSIKVEIVMGFLQSGKSNFINSMLKNNDFENETIVIIQDEFGHCEINTNSYNLKNKNRIIVVKNDGCDEITEAYLKNIIREYSPDRIFIEANGMKNSNSIINIFNDTSIKKLCRIDDIINVIDVKRFPILFRNMKEMLVSHIFNSNIIILNNIDKSNKNDFKNIQKEIRNINETARILKHISSLNLKELYHEEEYIDISNSQILYLKTLFYTSIGILLFILLATILVHIMNILMNSKNFTLSL